MEEYADPLSLGQGIGIDYLLAALMLAFVLSSAIAFIYRTTYQGLSYSRSFVHTQILASVITAVLIIAIGSNIARGLGILGTLAIVRFRTPIRDPRDIIFLFACIAIGIASGAGVFMVATVGAGVFCLVAVYLHWSPFGSKREYEGLLRFMLPRGKNAEDLVSGPFENFCSSVQLVAVREAVQGNVMEYAYQVRLRDPAYRADLLDALHRVENMSDVSLLMQRSTVEI